MKSGYLKGIIGSIIGGLIGAIPWLALAIGSNTMYAVLTFFIGVCAAKGYEFAKGKMSKATPWIIAIVCVLVITICNFVIMPISVILKEKLPVTMANMTLLYDGAIKDMIIDYVVALLFTLVGVSGVIRSVYNSIKEGKENNEKVEFNFFDKQKDIYNNDIKKYFLEKNATSEENAIELTGNEDLDDSLIDFMLKNKVLKITKDTKYYLDLERENKIKKRGKSTGYIVTIMVIVCLVLGGISYLSKNAKNDDNSNVTSSSEFDTIKYDKPKRYKAIENEGVLYFYPTKDLSGNSGLMYLDIYNDASYYDGFMDDILAALKADSETKIIESKEFDNKNKLHVVYINLEIKDKEETSDDIIYYIFYDNKIVFVEALTYNGDKKTITNDVKNMVESFKK